MKAEFAGRTTGSAVVAFMLVALIILGSMLMLHTAAVVTVGGTSRALEVARQNAGIGVRLERATREAAQSVYGLSFTPSGRGFQEELRNIIDHAPLGSLELKSFEVLGYPSTPQMFPTLTGAPLPLIAPSAELNLLATPNLLAFSGERITESATFEVRYTFSRRAVKSLQTYTLGVKCRLIAVPISRFDIMRYDLPEEIGKSASTLTPINVTSEVTIGPNGLVPRRDRADVPGLSTGSKRPGHYRYAAALSETYGYIFSRSYLQNATDYAGPTHFVQIGAGTANPSLSGGVESGKAYTLDVGVFGKGTRGPENAARDLAVFHATSGGCSLVLTDTGGSTAPILLVVAGPADITMGPIILRIEGVIRRPIVLVCYHAQLDAPADSQVNGAVLLDRDCTAPISIGPIAVGHVSFWAGSTISSDTFRFGAMPASAEHLMPRTIYVATAKTFL